MNTWLYAGSGLLIVALAQLIWAVRTKAPAHFFAQALVSGELGLMALAMGLITDEVTETVVVGMLGLGVLVSVWTQVRLVKQWRARFQK